MPCAAQNLPGEAGNAPCEVGNTPSEIENAPCEVVTLAVSGRVLLDLGANGSISWERLTLRFFAPSFSTIWTTVAVSLARHDHWPGRTSGHFSFDRRNDCRMVGRERFRTPSRKRCRFLPSARFVSLIPRTPPHRRSATSCVALGLPGCGVNLAGSPLLRFWFGPARSAQHWGRGALRTPGACIEHIPASHPGLGMLRDPRLRVERGQSVPGEADPAGGLPAGAGVAAGTHERRGGVSTGLRRGNQSVWPRADARGYQAPRRL